MTAVASIEIPNNDSPSLARRVAIGLLFAMLLYRAVEFAATGFAAVHYPWGLDYGEGIVWQQARSIFTPEAYGPIDQFPAIVFHYTPLYHAVASQVAGALGTDELGTGRAISLLSTLVAALAAGVIAAMLVTGRRRKQDRWLAGSAACLLVFTFVPIIDWAQLMRVDMLAFALSLLGLVAAFMAIDRPRLILVASLLFVAAIYTKQTAIAAPVATFAVLLATRPKLALQGIATCTALGVAALIGLSWVTDGGFYRHIFLYNVNRVEPTRLVWIVYAAAAHAIYVGLAGWMVARRVGSLRARYQTFHSLRSAGRDDIRLLIALAYFAVTTVMLLMIVKPDRASLFCRILLRDGDLRRAWTAGKRLRSWHHRGPQSDRGQYSLASAAGLDHNRQAFDMDTTDGARASLASCPARSRLRTSLCCPGTWCCCCAVGRMCSGNRQSSPNWQAPALGTNGHSCGISVTAISLS